MQTLTPPSLAPTTVADHFFHPLRQPLDASPHARVCPALPDGDWLHLGLTRVLHDCPSGRAFLQQYGGAFPRCPDFRSYFETLKSPRRLRLLRDLNARLQPALAHGLPDRFALDPALEAFDLFAGDGHWHAAAAHDAAVDGTKYATGHFYGLNLRTHGLVHLTAADQEARHKEHDMRALKRLDRATLRQGAPIGRKVLWVWDKAGIDFRQWHDWKQSAGIYFVSCAKENMALDVVGQNRWERESRVNQGVVADELVSTSTGVLVRRVTYYDPDRKECFEFLTTEFTLAPGWIAHLYRLRWDIEKVFDELKNKLVEKKAWASSATAKAAQAQFLCLTHNLMVLFERTVVAPAGVSNQAEDRRRQKRLDQTRAELARTGQVLPELVETLQRCTQRSVKFVRWLRAHFFAATSCSDALSVLRAFYAKL